MSLLKIYQIKAIIRKYEINIIKSLKFITPGFAITQYGKVHKIIKKESIIKLIFIFLCISIFLIVI